MTYYILIALCVVIIFSYIFELSAKYTKIPGVILLIFTGMLIHSLTDNFNIKIPDLSVLLPIMGTIGLILIVLEGSLDLTIDSSEEEADCEFNYFFYRITLGFCESHYTCSGVYLSFFAAAIVD